MTFTIIILTTILALLPMYDFAKKKQWVEFGIVVVVGTLLMIFQLLKNENDEEETAKKDNKINDLKTDLKLANQTCTSINTLAELNLAITKQIDSLQHLNNSISSNTQSLANDGKNLIVKNVALTKTIPPLTESVKGLVRKVDDEVTGGISIPLVTAYIVGDSIPYNFDSYQAFKLSMRTPTGKWILKINVQNSGYNKITDLSLIKYHRSGRYPPPEPETEILHSSETLLGNDLVNIESKELANVQPNLEDGRPPSYDLVGQWENLAYSIRVKWRKTSYTYSYIIRDGNSINIVGSYQFNGKGYSDSDADVNRFLKDIQEYIRNQDKANSN